ncbi:hypothetical protein [Candidatus Absconditicoccus praedator]|uniref:hypothetical protein n=1 Tax=Candidatus Absconditicoccus praedator TaxID=2735562 RepID=UPI001E503A12|nr:hypothetical protein [Candidatus Absconditicoccus praedator]UFX83188.1 hypothetical protein HLG78_03595 [Candidatus Absconditicoccus praedator]
MKILKFMFVTLIVFLISSFVLAAPSFQGVAEDGYENTTYQLNVDAENSLMQNIGNLFSPYEGGGQLWNVLRVIGVGIFIFFLVWAGAQFLLKANDESELKKAKMNILYIFYGGLLFFGSVWIFGTALSLGTVQGTDDLVTEFQDSLMFQVLAFLKAGAFFAAVVMIFYYGYRIIQAYDSEDKISNAKKGFLNVIIALIFIKVIDFVYYIAQQDEFVSEAASLLIDFAQIIGYVLGGLLLLTIFYAGILLITSRGDEEAWNKAKNIIKAIFLVVILIFLFLLIVYQVIRQLT